MAERLARQNRLLEQLAKRLAQNGFNAKPSSKNNEIYRPFPGGRHILHLATPSWGVSFEAVPDVAVRIDAIEDLRNLRRSRREASQTATVGADFHRLDGRRAWPIDSDADIAVAVRGIFADFTRVGEPYLKRFSSIEEILRVCSRDDKSAELAMDDPGLRAQIALAAACALGNKKKFEELLRKKIAWLNKSKDAAEIPRLRALAETLAKRFTR